jgi:hypothetical protein
MSRLLITNCTAEEHGGVYLLETRTGETRRVHDVPSRGITHAPDGIYVVGNVGDVYRLDRNTWKATQVAQTGLAGSHDLRWFRDSFYLVSSKDDLVARLSPSFELLDSIQLVEEPGDVCHANCLAEVDGELLLSIFTLSAGRREEKRLTPVWRTQGKILRLDWPSRAFEILYEPLLQPHSLVARDGFVYCCESFGKRVARVSLEAGTRETVRELRGFVRGLAFSGGSAFVGISRMRRKAPALERLVRRLYQWTGVLELDPETWRLRRRYPIPGSEVYEILPVDE